MGTVIPDDQLTTAVDMITLYHKYSGVLVTRGLRLADILSDPSLDNIEIHQTLVTSKGTRCAEMRCGHMLLAKKHVLMVVPKGSHEAPTRRRNNYQSKCPYGVMITLPGHVLSGVVHLPQRAHPWMLIDDEGGLPSFLGVTHVTVHSSNHGFVPERCDTVIVHRRAIETVELTTKPLPKSVVDGAVQAGDG